jgi:hypothetical protein
MHSGRAGEDGAAQAAARTAERMASAAWPAPPSGAAPFGYFHDCGFAAANRHRRDRRIGDARQTQSKRRTQDD